MDIKCLLQLKKNIYFEYIGYVLFELGDIFICFVYCIVHSLYKHVLNVSRTHVMTITKQGMVQLIGVY